MVGRVTALLAAMVLAGTIITSGAARADVPRPGDALIAELHRAIANNDLGPKVDVLAEASCTVNKGWIAVYIGFILALDKKRKAGTIAEDTDQKLSAWAIALQNYISQTADVEGTCRAMIAARKAHGF